MTRFQKLYADAIDVDSQINAVDIHATGTTTVDGALTANTHSGNPTFSGNVAVGGTLTVTGAQTNTGAVALNGGATAPATKTLVLGAAATGTQAMSDLTDTITSANGAATVTGWSEELITLATGATTTDSVGNLLPAGATILAVTARVTTTITTAANWQVGDATTAARFISANSTLVAGTTAIGQNQMQGGVATNAAGPVQAAAAKVRITTNVNPGAGAIRVTVFWQTFAAATA